MRSLSTLLVAALLATPAVAQDKPAWVGVWEGRIGSYPVRACFDTSGGGGWGRGSYYYRSRLEPLSLVEDEDGGRWTEHTQGSATGATWQFTEQSASRLRGTWRQGRRSLAFELTPVAWTEGEWGGPCGSEAYIAPRLQGLFEIRQRPGQLGDFAYEFHTLVPPEQFREDVAIETFQYTPEQPGDPGILAALRGRLPSGTAADPFADCLAGAISVHGTDGSYFEFLEPVMADAAFLGVRESSETYCGGAHPNAYYTFLTFDRQSGAAVELFDWLSDEAREHHASSVASEDYFTVRAPLREVIVAREPIDEPEGVEGEQSAYHAECGDVIADQGFWSLGLDRDGLLFVPNVPHVAGLCRATFLVPWDELEPFLSDAGRAGAARVRE